MHLRTTPTVRRLAPDDISLLRALNALFAAVFDDPGTYRALPPDDAYLEALLGKAHVVVLVAMDGETIVGGLVDRVAETMQRMAA